MGNNYKQYGPFIYGDPRFLAGGSVMHDVSYNDERILTCDESNVIVPSGSPTDCLYRNMTNAGQTVAVGKSGYHGNKRANVFVQKEDLAYPTAGVEIETLMRSCSADSAKRFTQTIYSNWFHAEGDGSLDRAHGGTYGYELVTAVLPARLYRDINVWTGFQNLVSPLLYSYSSEETGLHVHVGMSYFENTSFPATSPEMIMLVGKLLTTMIYYSFLPRSLAQRIFLRNSDLHYCHETNDYNMTRPIKPASGYEILDMVMDAALCPRTMVEYNWLKHVFDASSRNRPEPMNPIIRFEGSDLSSDILTYGHNAEVNAGPRLTLEFRRGKGTTNALSIHRIIELCVLTVMYSGHVIDNPGETVSTESLISYIIENTSSQALKKIAEKELSKGK